MTSAASGIRRTGGYDRGQGGHLSLFPGVTHQIQVIQRHPDEKDLQKDRLQILLI